MKQTILSSLAVCLLCGFVNAQQAEPKPAPANPQPPQIAPQIPQPGKINELKARLEDPEFKQEDRHLIEKELARSYISIGDFANAIKHMENSVELQEEPPVQEYQALGRLYLEGQKIDKAMAFLLKGEEAFPDSIDVAQLLTMCFRSKQMWKESVERFEKIEKINKDGPNRPFSEVFYFNYGVAVERSSQDIDRAAQLFQKSLERIPDPDPRNPLAVSQTRRFKAQVLNYLGYMQIDQGVNVDVAGELIKKAAALDPESGAIADSLGWFYFKKERYMDAMIELLRAESWSEQSTDGVILDHIAQTYHKMGNNTDAVAYIKRAIKKEPKNKDYKKRLKLYQAESE